MNEAAAQQPPENEGQVPEIEPPTRWEIELEFVQSLANPQYLNYLAQNKWLESEEFLQYLEYLEYWRKPENAQYIVYPNCLHVLTLLKEPRFRQDIARADVAKMFMDQYYMRWLGKEGQQQEDQPENNNDKPNGDAGNTQEATTDEMKETPAANGSK